MAFSNLRKTSIQQQSGERALPTNFFLFQDDMEADPQGASEVCHFLEKHLREHGVARLTVESSSFGFLIFILLVSLPWDLVND